MAGLMGSALALTGSAVSPARAQSAPDAAELYSMAKSLQARVAALEAENRKAKREAAEARAEASDLRKKLGAAPAHTAATPALGAAVAAASPAYAMATKAPVMPAPVGPSWGGLYAGVAFGLGSMHGRDDETEHSVRNTTDVGVAPGPIFNDTFNTVDDSSFSESGRNFGGIANLFLGYNYVLGNNVILGAQVEGGVSNIRVNLHGSGTDRSVETESFNPGTTTTSTEVTNFSENDFLDNKWMVSVLGRGGVLVTPNDYLYALGGYTYGRFEFGQSFGLNGATIGAGWERQLADGWTIRAEGRYTKFESKTLNSPFSSSSTTTFNNGAGALVETDTSTDASTTTDRISADMWSVWLGVAHYFH